MIDGFTLRCRFQFRLIFLSLVISVTCCSDSLRWSFMDQSLEAPEGPRPGFSCLTSCSHPVTGFFIVHCFTCNPSAKAEILRRCPVGKIGKLCPCRSQRPASLRITTQLQRFFFPATALRPSWSGRCLKLKYTRNAVQVRLIGAKPIVQVRRWNIHLGPSKFEVSYQKQPNSNQPGRSPPRQPGTPRPGSQLHG